MAINKCYEIRKIVVFFLIFLHSCQVQKLQDKTEKQLENWNMPSNVEVIVSEKTTTFNIHYLSTAKHFDLNSYFIASSMLNKRFENEIKKDTVIYNHFYGLSGDKVEIAFSRKEILENNRIFESVTVQNFIDYSLRNIRSEMLLAMNLKITYLKNKYEWYDSADNFWDMLISYANSCGTKESINKKAILSFVIFVYMNYDPEKENPISSEVQQFLGYFYKYCGYDLEWLNYDFEKFITAISKKLDG